MLTILVAIIGAAATIIASIININGPGTAFLPRRVRPDLTGKWRSEWTYTYNHPPGSNEELLEVKKHRGKRIYGRITMKDYPDKEWEFEGIFDGRFLQLMYYPAADAVDKGFLGFGCYCFELKPDGSFDGWSIGLDWDREKIEPGTHRLRRVGLSS